MNNPWPASRPLARTTMPLALFDLDHTLLDGDSNCLWLEYLVEGAHLPPAILARQADHMERYAACRLDIADYLAFHLRLLDDRPLAEWEALRARFLTDVVAPRIPVAARAAVEAHRRLGHRLAIVTATHGFLADAIGGLLDLPVICPRGEQRDGRFTGHVPGPLCFGAGKIDCVEHWLAAAHPGTAPRERHFYSDSANDLPLLRAVSHPVVVNGDAHLTEVAHELGWPRLSWRAG
ncbi:HAD-IB family hydrolase [Pseudothauera nasutitermitis]|uniref:HAD-IB family hydrolase n=1 Tax=Pseudothauera nasutitermitis TaxID=2565930 RepID=A0A4S4AZC6_9RHOO|nr:HAD-IB family phosphatase [Pseudothauera nasutitermitis]THF65530.1 HAD-IB family hydrolase [Pseudothauera nasutitermitis]